MKTNSNILEKIDIKLNDHSTKSLEKRIDRKVNPLASIMEDKKIMEETITPDIEGTGGTPCLSASRVDKETKSKLRSILRFESSSYADNPYSEYGLEDDHWIFGRRIDKRKGGKWKRVEDEPNLELFYYTLDEELGINEDKMSTKSTIQKRRYAKRYYKKNRIKMLRQKRKERRQTLNKKKQEYRKNRSKRTKTLTGKKRVIYHTKNHVKNSI